MTINFVFIRASDDKIQKAKAILKRLDVSTNVPNYLYVVRLKNPDAAHTVQTLKVLLTLLKFCGDDRVVYVNPTGRREVIFSASEEKAKEVRKILRLLEGGPK